MFCIKVNTALVDNFSFNLNQTYDIIHYNIV